jgi:hypothetical protein
MRSSSSSCLTSIACFCNRKGPHVSTHSWATGLYAACLVRKLAGLLQILTEICCRFPHFLQAYSGLEDWLGHECFRPRPLQFTTHQSPHNSAPSMESSSYVKPAVVTTGMTQITIFCAVTSRRVVSRPTRRDVTT